MAFIFGIDKMLYLSHLELSDTNQSVSWCDLVPESQSDLSSCERKSSSIILTQFCKIDEHSLSCLRSQISCQISCGSDIRFEHQIKGLRVCKVVSCLRCLYLQIREYLSDLLSGVSVNFYQDIFKLVLLLLFDFSLILGQFRLNPLCEQFIGSKGGLSLNISDHEIREFRNMS